MQVRLILVVAMLLGAVSVCTSRSTPPTNRLDASGHRNVLVNTLAYTVITSTRDSSNESTTNSSHHSHGLHFHFGRGVMYNLPLYVTPIIIVFGVIGNIISFLVLFRFIRAQPSSSDLHLCALAVFDIGGLLFSTMTFWLNSFVRLELSYYNMHQELGKVLGTYGACQTWFFLSFIFRYCSHWMIVIFTVERYLIISRPFKAGKTFTMKRAAWTVVILVIISVLINLHWFWTFDKRVTPQGSFCKWDDGFYIATSVHQIVMVLIPSTIIIVFNIMIVYSLVKHRKEDPRVSGDDAKDREIQITIRLVAVSVAFVALTFPFMAVSFYRNILKLNGVKHFSLTISELYSVTAFLFMCNYAVNFVLYCMTGSRFRDGVKRLFCCQPAVDTSRPGRQSATPSTTSTPILARLAVNAPRKQSIESNQIKVNQIGYGGITAQGR